MRVCFFQKGSRHYIRTPSRLAMLLSRAESNSRSLKSWQAVTCMASEVRVVNANALPPCSLEQTLLESFSCHI